MKIIDAHAHIFPEKIAKKATDSISSFYADTPMAGKGISEQLIRSGEKIGVLKYLVFSTATKKEQVKSINDFIISQTKLHPEFIGLGTMFIGYEDYAEELLRIKSEGLMGIKLHPDFQHFAFDDKKLYPIYDFLQSNNMFVLTHAGDPRYCYSNPKRIAKIASDFPGLKIIAAHFGGWSEWDEAMKCLCLENVFYDTSSTMGFSDLSLVNKLLSVYDRSHIFFGTDFPMWDHESELNNLNKTILSDSDKEDILYNNFCRFYGMFDKI